MTCCSSSPCTFVPAVKSLSEFGDLKSPAGLALLNKYLSTRSYVTGAEPSQDDAIIYTTIKCTPHCCNDYPHVTRWENHIKHFRLAKRNYWPKGKFVLEKSGDKKQTKKKDEDEDFDLFGECSQQEKDAAASLAASKKAEAKGKKERPADKSSLVIEIKPADAGTDLDDVRLKVKAIAMDGLSWGEAFNKVPVAFGLYKLQVSCTIIDSLVNTNELTDIIEALGMEPAVAAARKLKREEGGEEEEDEEEEAEGLVQSAEIVSFNKL
eukprot:GHVT01048989.1.p1 GENE.GHVT01048989.1~~GHVT01048989.1.p1  ORF type:complete len:266 (-),score=74.59 GHVT01048989.1:308-1105(-)